MEFRKIFETIPEQFDKYSTAIILWIPSLCRNRGERNANTSFNGKRFSADHGNL